MAARIRKSEDLSGSQEPYNDTTFYPGVSAIMPVAGVIIWNSHAFNPTDQPTTLAQYLDIEYVTDPEDRKYGAKGIFDARSIYVQQVPAFETREYCRTLTLELDATLYELGSHTHRWGSHFRTWLPPNQPCEPGGAFFGSLTCEPNCQCGPRQDEPIYESFTYTDPVQLTFDPPVTFGESVEDRTLLFCSLYDNGSTPTSPPVKTQSGSPYPPPFEAFGVPIQLGGPCPDTDESYYGLTRAGVSCLEGPNQGLACAGEDEATFCESAPGLADGAGHCNACEVLGGFTTEDEMFILLGGYFVPEPSASLLAASALATLALLAARRRRRGV